MKNLRYALWAVTLMLAGFLAWQTVDWYSKGGVDAAISIGGPFSAELASGEKITQKDVLGRPHVMFFGFTHCPDVCPTTLVEASSWLQELGSDADKLDFYFVSVDPERDTPEILSNYVSAFDDRIKGITGKPDEIAAMLKAYRIYAEKVPLEDDDYTMNHTASNLLMNAKGEYFGTIAYQENADTAVAKLKRLVATGS